MLKDYFSPSSLTWMDIAARVGFAVLLTFSIGLERFLRRKPIDFRPYVIISVSACGLLIGSMELLQDTADPQGRIDPTRVIQGVITGIGFLGAGAMFREGTFVQGAGSAASIWGAGAIGLVCGMGELWLAGIVSVIILVLMIASEPLTQKWDPTRHDD